MVECATKNYVLSHTHRWFFLHKKSNFSKKTRPQFATRKKLGIRLLFGYEYQAKSGVITCINDDIRASSNGAGNRASTEPEFGLSISNFDST